MNPFWRAFNAIATAIFTIVTRREYAPKPPPQVGDNSLRETPPDSKPKGN